MNRSEIVTIVKRVVVKVGTSVLTESGGDQLSPKRVQAIAVQAAALREDGFQVVLVTSGAIAAGMGLMNHKDRPTKLADLQAAAALGQGRLMYFYEHALNQLGFHAAQLLLTHGDLNDSRRRSNVQATLAALLKLADAIPVINENDSVAVDEIRYGDNDVLAADIAIMAEADLLVILSDVDGFLRDGKVVDTVGHVFEAASLVQHAKGTKKATSVGGMRTKLQAAQSARAKGIAVVIANGHEPSILKRVIHADKVGTFFQPTIKKMRPPFKVR